MGFQFSAYCLTHSSTYKCSVGADVIFLNQSDMSITPAVENKQAIPRPRRRRVECHVLPLWPMSVSHSHMRRPRTKIHTYSNAYLSMNEKVSVAWQNKAYLDAHVPGLSHRLLHDADRWLTGVLPTTDLAPSRHNVGSDRVMLVLTLDRYNWTETEREYACTCDYL